MSAFLGLEKTSLSFSFSFIPICFIDLAGLLQPNALPAANLPKENAQKRLFAQALPEIWLFLELEADL